MIKSKLVKAFMLGIGISAFMTNVVFAQMGIAVSAPPARGEMLSDDQNALLAKQKEIDQYLFTDHVKEISEKGFTVTNTGIVGDVVEIGITPYTKENVDYLSKTFGTEGISIVEAAENVLYADTTGIAEAGVGYAEPGVIVGATNEDGTAITSPDLPTESGVVPGGIMIGAPESTVEGNSSSSSTSVNDSLIDPAATDSSEAGTLPEKDQIYTTTALIDATAPEANSTTATAGDVATVTDKDVIFYSTAVGADQYVATDIKTVSAAENADTVPSSEGKDTGVTSTSMIVLVIAGGAVIVGGIFISSSRKKTIRDKN